MVLLLGMVEFLGAGWLWAGLGAVVAPVVVHWLSRGRGRRLVLPTARFFDGAVVGRRSFARPRDLLGVLVRVLILGLLVGAWARPVWRGGAAHADGVAGRAVVYVLDRSASMTRSRGGVTLFEAARRGVVDGLRSLDAGRDVAGVVLMDGGPDALLPEVTSNLGELVGLVEEVRVTYERDRFSEAVGVAVDLLRGGRGSRGGGAGGEVVVFSDGGFDAADVLGRLAREEPGVGVSLRVVGGGVRGGVNVGLSEAGVVGRAVVGQPVVLGVRVGCWGGVGGDDGGCEGGRVLVRLSFEGRGQERWVELAGGEAGGVVEFEVVPERVGVGWARFSVGGGGGGVLGFDDEAGVAVYVEERRSVGVVTGADMGDPRNASYYVYRALGAGDGVEAEVLGAVDEEGLRGRDTVVVVEGGEVGGAAREALRGYVSGGGVLVWVVDSERALGSFGAFGGGEVGEGGAGGVGWGLGSLDEPLLGAFEGAAMGALLGQRFGRVYGLPRVDGGRVVLRFDDGRDAVACWAVGRGAVAGLGVDLAPGESDFVKGPVFVAFLHELIGGLTRVAKGEGVVLVGDAPGVRLAGGVVSDGLRVVGPGGGSHGWGRVDDEVVRLGRVGLPGAYRVVGGDGGEAGGVWVGVDPWESRLERVNVEDVMGAGDVVGVVDGGGDGSGRVLWPYLVVGAVLLLGFERLVIGS